LFTSLRRGDVQLFQGARPDHAIGLQRVIELKTLHRCRQLIAVVVIDDRRLMAQVALAGQPFGQFGNPRILHPGTQQGAAGQRLPLRQRLLTLVRIHPAQVLIQLILRTRPFEGPRHVLQPRASKGQDLGLTVLRHLAGMPDRLEA